jgi:hypothetical protein
VFEIPVRFADTIYINTQFAIGVGSARGLFDSLGWTLRFGRQGRYMWTVPDILLTLFGVVLMVTPLALWVAWTTAIFTGVLVAALLSLIGAVVITRSQG